jgi:hypothetical protein
MRNIVEEEINKGRRNTKHRIVSYNICQLMCRYIYYSVSKKKNQYELYNKGYEKIAYNMNIMTYIRKMNETDLMKHLLFDRDQINLINFLSKPSISLGNKMDIFEDLSRRRNTNMKKEEIDNIFKSYSNEILKPKLKEADVKLMDLFKNEMELLIKE